MKTVIIAEKPSLARNIVNSAGGQFKNNNGWYENDSYCVTYAFGHLFTFYDIEDYTKSEKKRWMLDNLPFVPQRFWYKFKEAKGIREQFSKIRELVEREDTDLLVNAGDADNEGSYLVDLIIEATGTKKPVKRLWLPEQTEATIRKALENLPDNTEYKSYSDAGRGRAELDWVMGINYTRFLTLKCGQTVWAGRVLVPITKVIYDREMEIRAFKSEDYYQIQSETEINGIRLLLECPQKYELTEQDEAKARAALLNSWACEVVSVTKKQIEIRRPKLFSLSNAQGVLSKRHKIGMKESLEIIQKLYESGYITYPRTNTEYLAEEEKEKVHQLMETYGMYDIAFRDDKTVFDSSKVESHSALMPTVKIPNPKSLSDQETLVYKTILGRFLAVFASDSCLYDRTEAVIRCAGDNGDDFEEFKVKGDVLVQEGFQKYEKPEKASDILPVLNEGDRIEPNFVLKRKKTKAPSRFTVDSLNKFLKNPFKDEIEEIDADQDDAEYYRQLFKGIEIGTEATRTSIIGNAVKYQYISISNNKYQLEPDGEKLIQVLDRLHINLYKEKTVETNQWLKQISRGEMTPTEAVAREAEELKKNILNNREVIPAPAPAPDSGLPENSLGVCPLCNRMIYENSRGYYCSGYKIGCRFTVWKNDRNLLEAGISTDQALIRDLLQNGTSLRSGMTIRLSFNSEKTKSTLNIEHNVQSDRDPEGQ